jgi:hypothetical protein
VKYIVTVRGVLKDTAEGAAQKTHDAIIGRLSPRGRSLGSAGHRTFLNTQDQREFLAIDTWESAEGMQEFMSDQSVGAEIGSLFERQPQVTVWAESGWAGYGG